jgi:hypothetical protein
MRKNTVGFFLPTMLLSGCNSVLDASDVGPSLSVAGQAVNANQKFDAPLNAKVIEPGRDVSARIGVIRSIDGETGIQKT